jgi:integrase
MRGSIVQRGERLYTVVRPRDPATGRTREVWRAVPRPEGMGRRAYRQAAERQLRALLAEYDQRGHVAQAGRVTLGQHLEDWLRAREREGLRPSTVALYRTLIRSRIAPAIGALPLVEVTPGVVRRYLGSDAATQLLPRRRKDGTPYGRTGRASARTVQLQYAVLRAALQDAVDLELLARNPAARLHPPRAERQREPHRLTWEELAIFLEAAERVSPRYAALFRLAATTGLRVGSLLALGWDDVDWARSALRVRVAKTVTSLQAMPLDPDTLDALRRHRARQEEERAQAGPFWRDEGWVFANERGGAPRYRQVAGRELRRIVAAAGVGPVRMHDLRHTAGSRMLEAGVDPRTVADRLGHRDAAFFLKTYAGSLPSSHRRAAEVMGEGLRAARGKRLEKG